MRQLIAALRVATLFLVLGATACRQVTAPAPTMSLSGGASSIQLFVEPEAGVQPVVQFISNAQQTLDVAMYLLSDRDVQNALEAAPRRGVKVRVLLEEHPYGNGPGNDQVANRLKGAGIQVGWSPATFRLSHDKYAISDGRVALFGTPNWTHSAFSSNREYLLSDTDPIDVAQLAAIFNADWNQQSARIDDPNLVVSPNNARADFGELIASARTSLDVEAEELQDPGIENALVQAAKRGVNVRVILPYPTAGNDANEKGRRQVAAGGVDVRRLHQPYVHAKNFVVDGKEAFVGSENISTSSLDQNREVGLLIGDGKTIRTLEETFSSDWSAARP